MQYLRAVQTLFFSHIARNSVIFFINAESCSGTEIVLVTNGD